MKKISMFLLVVMVMSAAAVPLDDSQLVDAMAKRVGILLNEASY